MSVLIFFKKKLQNTKCVLIFFKKIYRTQNVFIDFLLKKLQNTKCVLIFFKKATEHKTCVLIFSTTFV